MNDYRLVVKQWISDQQAAKGVNEFIKRCNDGDHEILDITSHVTAVEGALIIYSFVFKVKEGGK